MTKQQIDQSRRYSAIRVGKRFGVWDRYPGESHGRVVSWHRTYRQAQAASKRMNTR